MHLCWLQPQSPTHSSSDELEQLRFPEPEFEDEPDNPNSTPAKVVVAGEVDNSGIPIPRNFFKTHKLLSFEKAKKSPIAASTNGDGEENFPRKYKTRRISGSGNTAASSPSSSIITSGGDHLDNSISENSVVNKAPVIPKRPVKKFEDLTDALPPPKWLQAIAQGIYYPRKLRLYAGEYMNVLFYEYMMDEEPSYSWTDDDDEAEVGRKVRVFCKLD